MKLHAREVSVNEALRLFPCGASVPWPRRITDGSGKLLIRSVETVTPEMHDTLRAAHTLIVQDIP